MKNIVILISLLITHSVTLIAAEVPVEEAIKALSHGDKLEIGKLYGEDNYFVEGSQYKMLGQYEINPPIISGVKIPSTNYRIALYSLIESPGSRHYDLLGSYAVKALNGDFSIDFTYKNVGILVLRIEPVERLKFSLKRSGGLIFDEQTKIRKIRARINEDPQGFVELLLN